MSHFPSSSIRRLQGCLTNSANDCRPAGSSRKNSRNHRVDVDAWNHPGLPHTRLDFTVVDPEAVHCWLLRMLNKRKRASAEKAHEVWEATASLCNSAGRFGLGLDSLLRKLAGCKRANSKAAKLLSVSLARCTAATILSATGHKACRGTQCAPAFPFALDHSGMPSPRQRQRHRQRQRLWVHWLLRAVLSVWLLFVLCYGPVVCAHSVHPRMGKRRSEDDGLVTGYRERSRPAEDQAGDRLPRDLRDGAANDQTHLLEGGDVRHGTSKPPGPAEPANTGTAGMAARLGQPQQQRLIADPLPHEQHRALPRRSPTSCAGRGCSRQAGDGGEQADVPGAWCWRAMPTAKGGSKPDHCSALHL